MQNRYIPALVGFLLGLAAGSGIGWLGLLLWNWLAGLTGSKPAAITAAGILPLGILFGLSLAIQMARPPLGD